MLGILPNCYRLAVSQYSRDGASDYIVDHSDIQLPTSDELLRIVSTDESSRKLKLRQMAFHCALLKLMDKEQVDKDEIKHFDDKKIPRQHIDTIKNIQKKQDSRQVLDYYLELD